MDFVPILWPVFRSKSLEALKYATSSRIQKRFKLESGLKPLILKASRKMACSSCVVVSIAVELRQLAKIQR